MKKQAAPVTAKTAIVIDELRHLARVQPMFSTLAEANFQYLHLLVQYDRATVVERWAWALKKKYEKLKKERDALRRSNKKLQLLVNRCSDPDLATKLTKLEANCVKLKRENRIMRDKLAHIIMTLD